MLRLGATWSWWKAVGRTTSLVGVVKSGGTRSVSVVSLRRVAQRSNWRRLSLSLWQCLKEARQRMSISLKNGPALKHRPLFLYGAVAFLWERERITDEAVKSCLKSYEERVRSGCATLSTPDSTSDSQPETVAMASSTSSYSWPSFTFGWFGASQLSQEKDEAVLSNNNDCQSVDEREMRCQQLVSELTEQYNDHTQRQLSQLPLVGLNTRTPRMYTLGSKLVQTTHGSLSKLIREAPTHYSVVKDQMSPVSDCCENGGSGVHSDLSCIGMALHDHSPPNEDWFSFGFDFALPSQNEEPSLYPLVGLHDKDSKMKSNLTSVFDSPALMRFKCNIVHMYDQILGVDFEPERTLLNQANGILNKLSARVLRLALNNKDDNQLVERDDNHTVPRALTELNGVTINISSMGDTVTDTSSSDYLSDWEMFVKEQSYVVYRKPYADTGLFQFKVIGTYNDVTAKDFYEVQVKEEARLSWDAYATQLKTVDFDPSSGCEVVHWVMKFPFPMSRREYLYVHKSWVSSDEDSIVFINRSVIHPSIPETRSAVRVKDYYSEMVIKAHTYIDEPGLNYELTYFDDPQVYIPSSCVNWVTTSAMPDFLSKVHNAALCRRTTNNGQFLTSI